MPKILAVDGAKVQWELLFRRVDTHQGGLIGSASTMEVLIPSSYIVSVSLIYQFDGVSEPPLRLSEQMTRNVELVYEEKGWPIALRDYLIKHRQLVVGTINLALNIFLRPRETVGEVAAGRLQSRTENYHVWHQASANAAPLRSSICGVS